jgi:hypothetical protein
MGFPVREVLVGTVDELARALAALLGRELANQGFHLQVWAPDTQGGQGLHGVAKELLELLTSLLAPASLVALPEAARGQDALLVQVCTLSHSAVAVGWLVCHEALSLGPRARR